MRENSEEGGVGSLNYLDTTPIPLDHEIRSLTIHMNPIIRHHLNFDSSTTNLKCSVFRPFGEKHVYDHILHTERLTITNNDMCCWPFVDVILEDSPPKRRSATRAKKRVVPTAAAEQQDQHIFVSDRLHMHPGVSRVDFFDTDFLPLPPHTFLFHAITQSIPLPTTRRPTSTIIFHLRSIIPPDAKSIMGDTSFFHDYVPPSKRPKPPTPTPEAKETNPWLISAPTPNLDKASASPEPAPAQGTKQKENNPWLISAPTPNLAPAPAAQEAPAAPATPAAAASAAPAPSAPVAPAPTPAAPPFPPLVYAAFPVIPVNNVQPQPPVQLYFSGTPVQVQHQPPTWFRNAARNSIAVTPVQVGIANPRAPAPPAAMPQVVGPLNIPTEYYCRELDGGYTLRTREQIATMTGEWAQGPSGFPYFIRKW